MNLNHPELNKFIIGHEYDAEGFSSIIHAPLEPMLYGHRPFQ